MSARLRSAAVTAAATAMVVLCAFWDPGVPAAAAAGLLLLAFLLVVDAATGVQRHLPAFIAGAVCTALTAAALLLPPASSVLAVVAGLGALVGAYRLTYSARR
ncbi:hypothetical protein E1293_09950 [Actinomadura darangshiensis]|uniref:Uncharacterized protein n=1 Tax=Actinomadura darangshiensis TaxID=705336 RepID=A0A4R5BKH8_9ACTN|nr:hypothetical protein [Actinomadura darangshiensis]TDD86199.1 hypothetical protein E1293_09950 [Actinomadura darangshiensis]